MNRSQQLAHEHDPADERARREAYLRGKRSRMPGLVEHQEALARGHDLRELLLRTADRGHVRRGPVAVRPGREPGAVPDSRPRGDRYELG